MNTAELLNLPLTPGNTDDRKPVPKLLKALFGKVFAERGYVSERLAQQLLQTCGIEFFAESRRNIEESIDALNRQAVGSGK